MKLFNFIVSAMIGVSLFASCKSEKDEILDSELVNYTFSGFEVETGDIGELSTRAEANYSLLAVDVVNGKYVQSVSRITKPKSEALSDITLPLKKGSHKIYILCGSKPWENFDENTLLVTWNEEFPLSDTWGAVVDVNVQSRYEETKQVTLTRTVSMVRVVISDAMPENLAKFRQVLVGGSWSFDLVQQCGDLASQIARVTDVPSSLIGKTGNYVSFYSFVPKGATSAASYTLSALDSDDNVFESVSFADVPMGVNRYATYKGNFFTYNNGFSLTLDDAFGGGTETSF